MNVESPYKGLDPFGESDVDALLFFGREREREIVVANLIASRLTVLYGPTGVGKSSLLRAAVARSLRELPEEPLVVVFDRWGDDPAVDLREAIAAATGEPATNGLVGAVTAAQRARDVYLVLDQTEEYFVYQGEGDGPFASELAALVAEPLRVNVLLSLREDSLSRLDLFKPHLPAVYANSLRLDRLDRRSGRAAILRPVDCWNALSGEHVVVEPALVDAVLDGVEAGQIEPAAGGLGMVDVSGRTRAVEAPYLQLVMQRVWDVERSAGSSTLRVATLQELGGARQVVADHLEHAIDALTPGQRDTAAQLFTYLVTPSGTKIAHGLPDLAEYAGVSEAEAAPVVETLSHHRILRPDEAGRTEIFHDVLAGEVLAWRRRHAAETALERERAEARRRHRRLLGVIGASAVLLAVMAGVTVYALVQRNEAQLQATKAETAERAALQAAKVAEAERAEADRQRRVAEVQRLKAVAAEEQADQEAAKAEAAQQEAEQNATVAEQNAELAEQNEQLAEQNAAEAEAAEQQAKQSAAEAQQSATMAKAERQEAKQAEAEARVAESEARARAKAQRAVALSLIRPIESLRLALEAARSTPESRLAESVLRSALASSRVRAILPGGGGPLRGASFSADGRSVLTVASRARVFDARTGALVRTLDDGVEARTAAFSPDGSLAVTGGAGGTARLWPMSGRALMLRAGVPRVLRGHTRAVQHASFSQDGRFVVTSSVDRTAIVWRVDTGEQVSVLHHEGPVQTAEFAPDGRLVVTVSRVAATGRLLANLYEAESGRHLLTFDQRGVRSAFFSPDGAWVVTTSNDDTTRIWTPAGVELARLLADNDVVSASFSPRGGALVTAAEGGAAYVWDTKTWDRELVLVGVLNPLTGASYSPDGRFILVSSLDRTVRIYRADNGLPVATLAGHDDGVVAASYAPDGSRLVTASLDGSARLWDPGTRPLLTQVGERSDAAILRVSFSPDGRLAVSAGADGTARILLVARHRQLQTLRHEEAVNDAEFNASGNLVVTASDDGTARIWRLGGSTAQVLTHGAPVLRAIFSPDGRLVATACRDGIVRLWRVRDGMLLRALRGHEDAVLDIAFSPDGDLIASAGDNDDRTARLWEVDGRALYVLPHKGPVARIAFSPDGRLLATASGDEKVRLWRVATGRIVHVLAGHSEPVSDVEFDRAGTRVVTASADRDARVWSVATGKTVSILRGHLGGPRTAAFSPNGRWVVTTGRTAVGLWDLSTGRFFAPTGLLGDPFIRGHTSGPLTSAIFAPDGRRILTSAGDGTVRTFVCRLCAGVDELIHLAKARLAALRSGLTPAERLRYLRG